MQEGFICCLLRYAVIDYFKEMQVESGQQFLGKKTLVPALGSAFGETIFTAFVNR